MIDLIYYVTTNLKQLLNAAAFPQKPSFGDDFCASSVSCFCASSVTIRLRHHSPHDPLCSSVPLTLRSRRRQEASAATYLLDVMVLCWDQQPRSRPSASQLVSTAAAPELTQLRDVVPLEQPLAALTASAVLAAGQSRREARVTTDRVTYDGAGAVAGQSARRKSRGTANIRLTY